MDKGLLSELLDGLTAVHSYLAKDIAKDKLSSKNQKSRQLFIQRLDDLIRKVQAASAQSADPIPSEPPPPVVQQGQTPPVIQKPPPKPPAASPPADEGGELYEVPDQVQENPNLQHQVSEYTSFVTVSLDEEEPQEEYLAMEADQREGVDDEMYEDPSQVNQDQEPELYEDPQNQPLSQPQLQEPNSAGGYMEPLQRNNDNRKSVVPVDLIDDWDSVYDQSNFKKKEKIKASKLKNVLIKGWLEKLGGRSHKNWQKRYCVLSDMFMYFYEKESSATYNNRIPIPGFVPNPSSELTLPKKHQFAFKLSSTDSSGQAKDYYFRAKTETERDQWVESVRFIFEQGRVAIETKKAQTLPANLARAKGVVPPIIENEQEEYEALGPGDIIPEEDNQEEYIDVSQTNQIVANNDNSQEEYMDVQQQGELDEPQEDYVEPQEIRQTLKTTSSSSLAPPLPPPPSSNTNSAVRMPLPPMPSSQNANDSKMTSSVTHQPLPPPPPVTQQPTSQQPLPAVPPPTRRPDPVIDTSKVYIQAQNGVQYNNVHVMLWDFEGVDSDEIRVKRGDLVLVSEAKKEQEWWFGELLSQDCSRKTGPSGLFPASYCTVAFEVA